jgi:putative oxidoreductase
MQLDAEKIIGWSARIIAAVIMFQTLFFKFSGSPESIYIFEAVGMEPWGRIGVGVGELIASVLLLIPAVSWMGAAIGAGLMAGAIGFHLTILGIEVQGDGGYLFFLAIVAELCSLFVLWGSRAQVRMVLKSL